MLGGREIWDWISLLAPVTFVICGLSVVILALIGSPKLYENSKNPRTQEQIANYGKNKTRLLHSIGGLILTGFGGYLLYCWIFGPIQR